MRGKVAKRIRKEVYQDKVSSSAARRYVPKTVYNSKTGEPRQIIYADASRNLYQHMKKLWKQQGK